jgi:hypothetical protein
MKAMRSLVAMIALSALLAAYPKPAAAAWDDYDDSQSNPLRVIA